MQRLEGHLEEITGNETLREVYLGTAKKTGLSPRAVESSKLFENLHQKTVIVNCALPTGRCIHAVSSGGIMLDRCLFRLTQPS